MKPRSWSPFRKAALVALLALGASSCDKKDRTRPAPKQKVELKSPAPQPEKDPEQVLIELKRSVHGKLDCADCHAPAPEGAPEGEVGDARCVSCHETEIDAYAETVHARPNANKGGNAAECHDCHGSHDIRAMDDPESLVHSQRLPSTCGGCHQNPELAQAIGVEARHAAEQYLEGIHGRGLVAQGLLVAPNCADCHGRAHSIFEVSDPESTVHVTRVSETCGQCHVGPRQAYERGVHGKAVLHGRTLESEGEVDPARTAPTCVTCHSAHQIERPSGGFRLTSDRICGECHGDRLERYLETYHGRAHQLGDESIAACHDCHGNHEIRPSTDPASSLSKQNRLQTCRKCHDGAPPNFAGFLAHADHSDKEEYPTLYWAFVLMTGLLLGTFGFFGVHSLMWFGRSLSIWARDPKGFREEKARTRSAKGAKLYQRFRPVDRFAHFLVIVSFLLLVITGMPLKFSNYAWAKAFMDAIGGPAVSASLHRFGAIVTLMYFIVHIGSVVVPLRRNAYRFRDEEGRFKVRLLLGYVFGPDSPLPRLKDAQDFIGHTKWFFGRGPRPKFDTFTYWEKFDYIAVFWGVTVIGLSGLVMWFPEIVALFLPGWTINLAHIIHSDEALLAAGFIFLFHFFNSHFRPDKFPFDEVMFSGHISEEEMRHEHAAQYERLKAEGRLEELRVQEGEWPQWRWVFNTFGALAIAVGIGLVVLIFWALLS